MSLSFFSKNRISSSPNIIHTFSDGCRLFNFMYAFIWTYSNWVEYWNKVTYDLYTHSVFRINFMYIQIFIHTKSLQLPFVGDQYTRLGKYYLMIKIYKVLLKLFK